MLRGGFSATALALVLVSTASAQTGSLQYNWRPGQVLTYRVEEATTATEVIQGKKTETTSKLNNLKRWQVLTVDNAGIATVQLSLTALRQETTTSAGEALLFDSADMEKSNPQLREQLSKYIGSPLALLRIDSLGKVIEVKECKGPASRFESEPPFAVVLPPQNGQTENKSWDRSYKITLEPPHGMGEKYDAVQNFEINSVKEHVATVHISTVLKSQPEAVADQVPLLYSLLDGEADFDLENGKLKSVHFQIDKELKGQQGEGSSYHLQRSYTEHCLSSETP